MATPRSDADTGKKRHGKKKKAKCHHDQITDILSALLPLAFPYLTTYLERYLGTNKDYPR
jgi:hypothetical protein